MDLLRLLLVFVDVADGVKVSDAWDWVCNNSKELGHYKNSDNAKHDFELTGSREVLGFYDLGNTLKILTEDKDGDGFWMAGGCCFDYGNTAPLNIGDYKREFQNKCTEEYTTEQIKAIEEVREWLKKQLA